MLGPQPLEHPLRRVALLVVDLAITLQPAVDDPGEAIQLRSLHRRLPREMLNCRAASRWLMPSAQASRTLRYMSTVKILPPSLQHAARK